MRITSPLFLLSAIGSLLAISTAFGAYELAIFDHVTAVEIALGQAVLYAAAAWLILKKGSVLPQKSALLVILGVASVARIMLLPFPPISTDIYRYVWDGRVQAHGVDPYAHVPADPQLAGLRDQAIFPRINRADTAVTIYPPAAQMIFFAVTRIAETVTTMKIAMTAFEALIIWAILKLLRSRNLPQTRVLLYAWHPLPLWEFSGSGHIDVAAIALMIVALLAADRRFPALAGAALALGAGVKFFPAFIAPALYQRWSWRLPVAFVVVFVLLYLPYLGAGWGVFGYLPGYAQEEGLAGGSGVFWLSLLKQAGLDADPLGVTYFTILGCCLIGLAVAIAFRRDHQNIALSAAMLLLVAFTLVITPHYPWYMTWSIPLLCLYPNIATIYLTLAAPLLYGFVWPRDQFASEALIYLPCVSLLFVEVFARRKWPHFKEFIDGRCAAKTAA